MRYLHSTPPFLALPDARDHREEPPAAQLLAAAVHAQSEGLLIIHKKWGRKGPRIIFANESFCAMSGLTVAELRTCGLPSLYVEPGQLDSLRQWVDNLQAGVTLSGEGRLTRKNGATMYSSWSYCPIADARGRVTHIVATFRDLTETRRLQDELMHSQRLDAVGRLAGGVAHDFNNLLSVINGYCEIMATKASIRRYASKELEEIHLASQKAATLVRQLLAFSRRQAMNPKVVSLNQLVRDNSEIFSRLLKPSKRLVLSLEPASLNIRVDPAQLQQVLLNLVINARDALQDNGRVTITTSKREIGPDDEEAHDVQPLPLGRYAVLAVNDNGVGMPADVQAHLFEPFFTTKESGQGTGLGLALVYGVVQQSGGYIRVHSVAGEGSTFEVYIPEVCDSAVETKNPIPVIPVTQGRETVLIVEEDDVVRKMVATLLMADGYTVLSERTADDGLDISRRLTRPVDLLITQLGAQPGSDGEKLTRTLLAEHPQMKVLALCNPECSPLPFVADAAQVCVAKPFALSSLVIAIRELLDVRIQ